MAEGGSSGPRSPDSPTTLDGLFDLLVSYVQRILRSADLAPGGVQLSPSIDDDAEAIRLMGAVGLIPEYQTHILGVRLFGGSLPPRMQDVRALLHLLHPHNPEPQDVERLSAHLGIGIRETVEVYAHRVEVEGYEAWAMKKTLAAFLDEAEGLLQDTWGPGR